MKLTSSLKLKTLKHILSYKNNYMLLQYKNKTQQLLQIIKENHNGNQDCL